MQDYGPSGAQLRALLEETNGFFAFYSALLVRPSHEVSGEVPHCLEAWNAPGLWREGFGAWAEGLWFFAEDLFGVQFALLRGSAEVWTFDPETGERSLFASDVEDWCSRLLSDPESTTGYLLAKAWQDVHGPLPQGRRLVPSIPFVLGGAYSVSNLWASDAVEGMRSRAAVARQIADLPDGARVRITVTE